MIHPSFNVPAPPAKTHVLISGTLASGGVGTQVAILCRLLLHEGARVSCCATHCQWSAEEVAELRASGVNVHLAKLGGLGALLTWPLTIRRKFDVLYCIGHGRSHTLARRFLLPGGLALYHEVLDCPAPQSVAARTMPIMDGLVANSRVVGRDMQARWPNKPVRVIPFLTAERIVGEPPPRPPVDGRELRVVYLGRLVEYKGAPDSSANGLRSASVLPWRQPGWIFTEATSIRPHCRACARRLKTMAFRIVSVVMARTSTVTLRRFWQAPTSWFFPANGRVCPWCWWKRCSTECRSWPRTWVATRN